MSQSLRDLQTQVTETKGGTEAGLYSRRRQSVCALSGYPVGLQKLRSQAQQKEVKGEGSGRAWESFHPGSCQSQASHTAWLTPHRAQGGGGGRRLRGYLSPVYSLTTPIGGFV